MLVIIRIKQNTVVQRKAENKYIYNITTLHAIKL